MKSYKEKSFLISSIFLILIFPISGLFESRKLVEKFKNKRLISLNDVRESEDHFKFLEHYTNDHLGLQKDLIPLKNYLLFKSLGLIRDKSTLLGENGFFFTGGKILTMFQGTHTNIIDEWIENLQKISDSMPSNKKKIFIYLPEKIEIYNNLLPTEYEIASKNIFADALLKKIIEKTQFEIIDLRIPLNKFKSEYPLYYKGDLHWNELGALISTEYIYSKIHRTEFKFDINFYKTKIKEGNQFSGNLYQRLGFSKFLSERYQTIPIAPLFTKNPTDKSLYPEAGFNLNNRYPFTLNNSKEKLKLFFLHGSFGLPMAKFLGNRFQEVTMINPWHTNYINEFKGCYLLNNKHSLVDYDIFMIQALGRRSLSPPKNCHFSSRNDL